MSIEETAKKYVRDQVIGLRDDPQADAEDAFIAGYALALRDVPQGQSDAEMLAMVLKNIALGHDCCCDHSDESCCNKVGEFCPTCIAEVALAARHIPVGPAKEEK